MDIDEKTIKAALLKGERVTLECKKAQSNVPIDMWKTYSAFANTYSGNQCIQNIFRMIGFGENLGSGFPLILSAWNEKHWLKPELIEQRELLQVKLVLSIETKEDGSIQSKKGQKDSIKDDPIPEKWPEKWPEKAIQILRIIKEDRNITIPQLEVALQLGHTTIKKILREMQNENFIRRIGPATGGRGYWEVIEN
ncbi:MAG: hypothetical protein IJQ83_02950 [Bacteroidales bacterium]|nr:hypothetical protein [Bacteroidales bacterium]